MKETSLIKPIEKFKIEKINDETSDVVLFDLDSIEEVERDFEEDKIKEYSYYTYRLSMTNNSNLLSYITENYDKLLAKSKEAFKEELASEIRTKRDKLLEESDKEMAIDRFNLDLPDDLSLANIVATIKAFFAQLKQLKNNDWAKYRQQLRSLPEQKGFPFDVEFPKKPNK